ncbi:hypothetical protein U8Q02_39075 (plasmid) [Rhizobium leguminosarum]|nr:hypothetical protein U8Q02_39075 [Rhizobium leguminosarum]
MMRANMFKSVNIRDDVGHPKRFSHYHPTSRSAPLIAAVLGHKATMVIASYGSGKSLSAGIGVLATVNDPAAAPVLSDLASRIGAVDAQVAEALRERVAMKTRGRAVVLSGYVSDLPAQIAEALDLGEVKSVRAAVAAIRKLKDVDHVAIVWDEFGRHLEGLVRDARTRDLEAIQDLSELVVRPEGPTISLTLLLHQNLLAYAQTLNQTSRNEWRKIEGRFEQHMFVEDSRELYALAAKLVSARAGDVAPLPEVMRAEAVSRAIEGRWFDDVSDADEMRALQERAWPLTAAALQALPRLVARVGQNERTLFSFIEQTDFDRPVGMNEVYEAFSQAIQSDVGIGGLHRQWVEVESARSRTDSEIEREALAATFLLQAGASGERRRLKRSVLVGALVSKGATVEEAEQVIESLAKRKLVIHRKLNDEMSVWHGADVDVASRLRDERIRLSPDFDLMAFLARQHAAPFIRPVRHNVRNNVSRYLTGGYVRAGDLQKTLDAPFDADWGRIVYVLADTADQVAVARALAKTASPRTILVFPTEAVPVSEAALEVEALLSLKQDDAFLSEDPLVVREIDELLAIARRQLTVVMHRLTTDRPSGSEWWADGSRLKVSGDRPAGIAVSDILDGWYPLTPKVVNDQIVRTKISRNISTARIRMITRLVSHSGTPGLGYPEGDGSAEASIYRTVLARTGLHFERDGAGVFADPSELADKGLMTAWSRVEDFYTRRGRRKLSELVDDLSRPPIGMAAGLVPIFVMAGYKAFARAVTIRTREGYVRDVMGFISVKMFEQPDEVEIEVHQSSPQILRYLEEFANVFLYEKPGRFEEKVLFANLALETWGSSVAQGARSSRRMSDAATKFLRAVSQAQDPAELILDTLPSIFGPQDRPYAARLTFVIGALKEARDGVDGLVNGYLRDAVDVIEDVLRLEGSRKRGVEAVHEWFDCLDGDALQRRSDLKMTDKTVLRTLGDTKKGRYSVEGLARVVSSVLMTRGVEKWQDDTKEHFRKELREARTRIEEASLATEEPPVQMAPIIRARMLYLANQLERIERSQQKEKQ